MRIRIIQKISTKILILLLLTACGSVKKTAGNAYDPGPGWKLDWSEEFNGENLDTNIWNYELGGGGWGNSELEEYTSRPENIYLTNGNMVIRAIREKYGFMGAQFTSARINTYEKYSFKYGKIVGRMKLPYGAGIWPAFWMMGESRRKVMWPMCGEIDIMEMRGGGDYGDAIVGGAIHYHKRKHLFHQQSVANLPAEDSTPVPLYLDYHYFELEWDEGRIYWRLDQNEFFSFDISGKDFDAFRKPFYIILNLAVGGTYVNIFSSDLITAPFPQYYLVDWIRVYKKDNK